MVRYFMSEESAHLFGANSSQPLKRVLYRGLARSSVLCHCFLRIIVGMRKTTFINYWAPAIMVIMVVVAGVLLFASAKGHTLSVRGPHSTAFRAISRNSESGLPSSLTTMLTASEN